MAAVLIGPTTKTTTTTTTTRVTALIDYRLDNRPMVVRVPVEETFSLLQNCQPASGVHPDS
jgi:hypothetical protein